MDASRFVRGLLADPADPQQPQYVPSNDFGPRVYGLLDQLFPDPYKASGDAVQQYRKGDLLGAFETMFGGMPTTGAIKAYHGSPHSFDKFDLSKIGTGEGAQAYGHGLYFAENPAVAQEYRSRLAGRPEILSLNIAGRRVGPHNGFDYSPRGLDNYDNIRSSLFEDLLADEPALVANPAKAQELAVSRLNGRINDLREEWPEGVQSAEKLLADIKRPGAVSLKLGDTPGAMYEVNINSDPKKFLNWENEFTKQSPQVKEALKSSGIMKDYRANLSDFASPMTTRNKQARGENIYDFLSHKLGGYPAASNALKEMGIDGTRYLDAGSRDSGKKSFNLSVFDDSLVDILKRYGLAGLLGGGAAAYGATGNNQAQPSPLL